MVQELGENRSARVHSSFSHPDLLFQAPLFPYLTSNRKKLQSHLIPFLPVHWGDSSSRLPDSTGSRYWMESRCGGGEIRHLRATIFPPDFHAPLSEVATRCSSYLSAVVKAIS